MSNVVVPRASEHGGAGRQLSSFCEGPWEPWFQVELYLRAVGQVGLKTRFRREVKYPGSKKSCDFQIAPHTGITIWVELKVMLHDDPVDLAVRYVADLDKLSGLDMDSNTNTVGAIAWAPAAAEQFLATLKDKLPKEFPSGKTEYVVLNSDGLQIFRGNLDQQFPMKDSYAVVVWYVAI